MASVTSFIRNTPAGSLRAYFDQSGIKLPVPVNWDAPETEVVRTLLRVVDDIDDDARARIENVAERVTSMVDEAGQAALYSVAQNPDQLDALQNSHERSLWMFLRDPVGFRHAEEVRFTDERRRGRMWDGFIGEPNLVLQRDAASVDAFKAAIRDRFQSNNAHVDMIGDKYLRRWGIVQDV